MNNKLIIAGNWKMHKTVDESLIFFKELNKRIKFNSAVEILIFPPFTSLYPIRNITENIKTGAQNFFNEAQGAYTGEVSYTMLNGLVQYLLIGHSERRHIFNETDLIINQKIKTALLNDFIPLLCIGETLEERERGDTFKVIENQLSSALSGFKMEDIEKVVIAYEPVWAIGTGKTASPEQAQEVHAYIRKQLLTLTDKAESTFILYGGSVKPENSHDLLSQKDINGALIGGASLKLEDFFDIITNSYKLI